MGFEPTNGGFADLSLGPLGYRAKQSSITKSLSRLEHRIEAVGQKSQDTPYDFISFRAATILELHAKTAPLPPAVLG